MQSRYLENTRSDAARMNDFNPNNQYLWTILSLITENTISDMIIGNATLYDIYEYARLQRKNAADYLGHNTAFGFGIIRNGPDDKHTREEGMEFSTNDLGATGTMKSIENFRLMKEILQSKPTMETVGVAQPDIPSVTVTTNFKDTHEYIKIKWGDMDPETYVNSLTKLNVLLTKFKTEEGIVVLQTLGLLTYKLCRLMPLVGGSAAIAGWLTRGIAKSKGFDTSTLKVQGLAFDVCALIQENHEEFLKGFDTNFVNSIAENNYKTLLAAELKTVLEKKSDTQNSDFTILSHILPITEWKTLLNLCSWEYVWQQLTIENSSSSSDTEVNLSALANIRKRIPGEKFNLLISNISVDSLIRSSKNIDDLQTIQEMLFASDVNKEKWNEYITNIDTNSLLNLILVKNDFDDETTAVTRLKTLQEILSLTDTGKDKWISLLTGIQMQSRQFFPTNADEFKYLENTLTASETTKEKWFDLLRTLNPIDFIDFASNNVNRDDLLYLKNIQSKVEITQEKWDEYLNKIDLTNYSTDPNTHITTLKNILTEENWSFFLASLNKLTVEELNAKGIQKNIFLSFTKKHQGENFTNSTEAIAHRTSGQIEALNDNDLLNKKNTLKKNYTSIFSTEIDMKDSLDARGSEEDDKPSSLSKS